ncbi:MAG: 16S rRNA (guanine(966)-N(2))-methyltransferase RsmD [Desulfotignum sp.]|nr:16S rRNA (guanine(966)-N(2))-methyltransferase RsmD [Desulfotignum sp.]MCF8112839.1 16S rRNA (guanine(966)-N(2))-methyltransferase RsmD [Desulfotignum sp.]MCF8125266.1 16S rRNA (guanine(966)-N(2))-methyltransferase RsmD [Desulfotignum sp.]
MRVISGTCRGKKLIPLEGRDIRPTSDRIKETVFNILGARVKNAQVLDLFAGTGALGLEALSRGAAHAVFVDLSAAACNIIAQNIDRCRFSGQATLIQKDLFFPLTVPVIRSRYFDLIFLDPPYNLGYVEKTLAKHNIASLLSDGGLVVAEHAAREILPRSLNGLDIFRQKKYSRTTISFLTRSQDPV